MVDPTICALIQTWTAAAKNRCDRQRHRLWRCCPTTCCPTPTRTLIPDFDGDLDSDNDWHQRRGRRRQWSRGRPTTTAWSIPADDTDGDGIQDPVDALTSGRLRRCGWRQLVHPTVRLATMAPRCWQDLDSDNDGINDVDEGGNGPTDTDNDGMVDPGPDTDNDGIQDPVDGDPGTYGDLNDPVHRRHLRQWTTYPTPKIWTRTTTPLTM